MQPTSFKRDSLALAITSFIISMLPVHFWPPVMAAPNFSAAWIGDQFIDIYTYAFHFGFAVAALVMLALSRLSGLKASQLHLWAVLLGQVLLVVGVFSGEGVAVACRFLLGAAAVPAYAAAYASLKASNQEYRVPLMLALSSVFLESSAFASGIVVQTLGYDGGLKLAAAIWMCLMLLLLFLAEKLRYRSGSAMKSSDAGKTVFSGSRSLMVIAIFAHGAFFLMLVGLGQLPGTSVTAGVIGAAVFATALAFPIGSMIPFEKAPFLRSPDAVTLLGSSISIGGILIDLIAVEISFPLCIVIGTAIAAFGNGATLSRCFQNASVESQDGESSPILIMAGVMLFTVLLGLGMRVMKVDGLGAAAGSFIVNFALSVFLITTNGKLVRT